MASDTDIHLKIEDGNDYSCNVFLLSQMPYTDITETGEEVTFPHIVGKNGRLFLYLVFSVV